MTHDRLRLGLIGAGWITPMHLAAFDRLDRTELVGVASARLSSAEATAGPRGAAAYDDAERMLDEQRPDIVYVAVPPVRGDRGMRVRRRARHPVPGREAARRDRR